MYDKRPGPSERGHHDDIDYRGVLEARQTSDGAIGVGSTLQTVVKAFGRRRSADYLVTEYEPNHGSPSRSAPGR